MTVPDLTPLPIVDDSRLASYRTPKSTIGLLLIGIMFSVVAAAAGIYAARAAGSGAASRDDVIKNREYLFVVCQEARRVAEALTGETSPPCPPVVK